MANKTFVQGTYPQIRNIAQGETFVIYFRILPSELDTKIDEVYAQTDEGIESNHLLEPMFGETMNVFFTEEDTLHMFPGEHHVRMWAVEEGRKYVLFETIVQINPGFPFTPETRHQDYVYTNNSTKNVGTKTINVSLGGGSGISSVQTYPVYRGKLDQPWMFNPGVDITVVSDEGLKPVNARVGDLCIVTSEESEDSSLYICISEDPVTWRRIGERVFAGSYSGLVPESDDATQDSFLKGDGSWSKITGDTVESADFILNGDNVDIDCDF